MTCRNRTTLTGECVVGCGGFGHCRQGHEKPLPPRDYNPLTGRVYTAHAGQYFAQMLAAERMMAEEHNRLLAAGAVWDGMDGYDLTGLSPQEVKDLKK